MTRTKRWVGVCLALILLTMTTAFQLPLLAAPPASKPPAQSSGDTPIKVQGDLVNIRASASYDSPGVPFLTFLSALKAYPKARRFRVSWSLLIFMNSTNDTVLYDRRRHTMLLYSYGGGDVLGSYQSHVLFTGVRESAFGKIVAAHKNDSDDMGVWSWFSDLPRYGCRKRDLGSWERSPSH